MTDPTPDPTPSNEPWACRNPWTGRTCTPGNPHGMEFTDPCARHRSFGHVPSPGGGYTDGVNCSTCCTACRPAPSPTPVEASGRANRGDEVQIAGSIGNIVRMNDREGTCDIAWWMPTGGPYGSSTSVDVPLDGLHVRQQATTSLPAPASPPVGERLDVTALPEWEALLSLTEDGRARAERASGGHTMSPLAAAVYALIAAADRGDRTNG